MSFEKGKIRGLRQTPGMSFVRGEVYGLLPGARSGCDAYCELDELGVGFVRVLSEVPDMDGDLWVQAVDGQEPGVTQFVHARFLAGPVESAHMSGHDQCPACIEDDENRAALATLYRAVEKARRELMDGVCWALSGTTDGETRSVLTRALRAHDDALGGK